MSIVPVVVKLDWLTVKSPPFSVIVPLLRWADDVWLSVSAWLIVTVPRLSNCTPSVRPPPAPASTLICPPAALTRLPLLMFKDAPRGLSALVNSITPLLVNPRATFKIA